MTQSVPTPIDIRPARAEEAVPCRAMLPDAFPPVGRAPELFVAEAGGAVCGAAAMAWMPGGVPILVHVHERFRRRGVGRGLIEAAARAALGDTAQLRGWTPLDEGSADAQFLGACGFAPSKRLLRFETDGVRFERAMTGLLARMRPRIPPDAQLVGLRQAPADAVVALVAPQLALFAHDIAARIVPGSPRSFDPELSFALMRGDSLVGAILSRRVGNVIEVEANVVAPDYRRGWANLMLVEGVTRLARATPGVERCRFSAEEHVTDTVNMGRRTHATFLPALLVMTRPLYSAAVA